jgi:hypothetical protein
MITAVTEFETMLEVWSAMEIDLDSILVEVFEQGLLSDLSNAF